MMEALFSSISGLNGFQTALNNQANNVANVNTVAFKSDNLSFADQMYQSSIGKGVKTNPVIKDFTQGELKVTGNTYDVAIEGPGFFIAKGEKPDIFYSRAGNFFKGSDGALQLPGGYHVLGLPISSSNVVTNDLNYAMFNDLYTNFLGSQVIKTQDGDVVETINAKATDYTLTATSDDDLLKGTNYKTRDGKLNDVEALTKAYRTALSVFSANPVDGIAPTNQSSSIPFDLTKITTEFDSLEINIGNTTYRQAFNTDPLQTMKDFADTLSNIAGITASVDTNGVLTVSSMIPGQKVIISDANILNGDEFVSPAPQITTTVAEAGSGRAKFDAISLALEATIANAGGNFMQISTIVDATTIVDGNFEQLQLQLDKLGLTDTSFGNIEFDNGVIYMSEGNNRFVIGRLATADFVNDTGLAPQGDNLYKQTKETGNIIYSTDMNTIVGKTLEQSNTNLSVGLVDLMVFQRSYEANSKTLTTSDELLKTALALKK